jgi:hypothetical protein
MVFENIFDLILKIIEDEGGIIDGGVVVNDCLQLLFNILQTHYSNKIIFMEAKYVCTLSKFLNLDHLGIMDRSNSTWLISQTITNISMLLKIIRCLLEPELSDRCVVLFFQKEFARFKLLNRLFDLYVLTGSIDNLHSEVKLQIKEI